MTLKSPFTITPRLLPGVRIGKDFISIMYAKRPGDKNRLRYQYHIDAGGKEHTACDLQTGNGGGYLQEGMENLLGFLEAAAEAYRYSMQPGRTSENLDMFPAWVNEWAYQNSEEIGMMRLELEEKENLIEE